MKIIEREGVCSGMLLTGKNKNLLYQRNINSPEGINRRQPIEFAGSILKKCKKKKVHLSDEK